MNGMNIFGKAPMIGVLRAGRDRVGGHGALDLDEVRRPVAEGQHEPEAEHDADDRQQLGVEAGERLSRPGLELLGGGGHPAEAGALSANSVIFSLRPP